MPIVEGVPTATHGSVLDTKEQNKSLLRREKILDTIGKEPQENELDKHQKSAIFNSSLQEKSRQ